MWARCQTRQTCQGLRYVTRGLGNGTGNGSQRLTGLAAAAAAAASRQLSTATTRARPAMQPLTRHPHGIILLHQSRHLSLFGWGSSSSSSPPSSSSSPPPSTHSDSEVSSSLHVKASHATSDSPDPTSSAFTPAPQALGQVEDRLSLPTEFDPTLHDQLSSTAEHVGFLRDVCGLKFGIGPSTFMEYAFEVFHVYSGMSWTLSVIAVSLVLRLIVGPLTIKSQRMSARMREIQPVLKPLRDQHRAAVASGDRAEVINLSNRIRAISREAEVKLTTIFIPMLIQIPLSYGAFRCLRSAAMVPVPALETESFLHHTNMAIADPVFMPIVGAFFTWLAIGKSMKLNDNGNNAAMQAMQGYLKYIMPAASCIFMYWQPGIVQVFFLTQTLSSCGQTYLLGWNPFRRLVGLPPTTATTQPSAFVSSPSLRIRSTDAIKTTARQAAAPAPAPAPEPAPAPGADNISFIDKGVNKFKDGWSKVMKTGKGKRDESVQKKVAAHAERFEYAKRQEIESERAYRNQTALDAFERQRQQQQEPYETQEQREQPQESQAGDQVSGMKIRKRKSD